MKFQDREEAGRVLASKLAGYAGQGDVVVLALPRGGVPVALEIARAIRAPLDVLVVRKLGAPGQEELAMGAVAADGVRVLEPDVARMLRIPDAAIEAASADARRELVRRERLYRGGRPRLRLRGRTVILVDDGLATGSSMRAAIASVRQQQPARVIIAVPVAAREVREAMREHADEVVCAAAPGNFYAVGMWYEDFPQLNDDDVRALLARAQQSDAARADADPS